MLRFGRLLLPLLAGIVPALAADVDSAALLNRLKARVRENAASIPRFVCRIRLERLDYAPAGGRKPCRTLTGHELDNREFTLRVSDRANLDVILTRDGEMFAWPGGQGFEAITPNVLLGGGFSGSGDFSSFLTSVFVLPGVTIEYQGPCETSACVRYRYDVPSSASKYTLQTLFEEVIVGYHGFFEANPETADLISLTVIPTGVRKAISGTCDMRTEMTYAKAAIASGVYTIPQSTEKLLLAQDGTLYRNRIFYQSCREYTSESSISFGEEDPVKSGPPKPGPNPVLPSAGTRLNLRLVTKIDSEKNSAGDPVEARLSRAARDESGHSIPAGTLFRGHITRVQTMHERSGGTVIGFRFDSMVLDGTPVPVKLDPAFPDNMGNEIVRLQGRRAVLNAGVESRWRFEGAVVVVQ
ncbi:MAG TPA: hypothetical protein VEF06_04815 [Bryobacteraceae bacterium]|nr:hypothetical protein [Bryobacteraceae bacterium]